MALRFLNKKPQEKTTENSFKKTTSGTNPTRFLTNRDHPFFRTPSYFGFFSLAISGLPRRKRVTSSQRTMWVMAYWCGRGAGARSVGGFWPRGKFFESRWLPKKDVCFCSPDLSVSDTISLWPQRKKWIKHSSPIKTHFPWLLLLKCFFGLCQIFFWWVVSSQKFTI